MAKRKVGFGEVCCRRRNPHECAVAKTDIYSFICTVYVATRTYALGQRSFCGVATFVFFVATRTNALWQRDTSLSRVACIKVATRTNALWQRNNIRIFIVACFVATRTNALWQRSSMRRTCSSKQSQPARMRCGKDGGFGHIGRAAGRNPHECAVAKVSEQTAPSGWRGRNPHECAVAKSTEIYDFEVKRSRNPHECAVANFYPCDTCAASAVATRTNALWQRLELAAFAYKKLGRNPHECAVAKIYHRLSCKDYQRRNPHECAEAKSRHCCARTGNSENMNYVLLF